MPNHLISRLKQAQRQYIFKFVAYMPDNAPDFVNSQLRHYFRDLGIKHEVIAPNEPHINGLIERLTRTLKTTMRSLLLGSGNVSKTF